MRAITVLKPPVLKNVRQKYSKKSDFRLKLINKNGCFLTLLSTTRKLYLEWEVYDREIKKATYCIYTIFVLYKIVSMSDKMKPSDWIALCAFFVSIFAIIIGIQQYKAATKLSLEEFNTSKKQFDSTVHLSIQHDKYSVIPLMEWHFNGNPKENTLGLLVRNEGLGPAIIFSIKKYYKGSVFNSWQGISIILNYSGRHFWKNTSNGPVGNEFTKCALQAGESKNLYTLSNSELESKDILNDVFDSISFKICYTNIYHDTLKPLYYNKNLIPAKDTIE
jgi:hypothetical protein